jgi:acyl-CoA thioester hydrolase
MAELFSTTRRVEFRETDAAGIAHFSAFLCYMEQAEHDLLRTLDWSVMIPHGDSGYISWPRVHVECDFQGTVQFEDVLDITVHIARLGTRSVTYAFQFICKGRQIASGKTIAVCCHVSTDRSLESIDIPAQLRERFQRYVLSE